MWTEVKIQKALAWRRGGSMPDNTQEMDNWRAYWGQKLIPTLEQSLKKMIDLEFEGNQILKKAIEHFVDEITTEYLPNEIAETFSSPDKVLAKFEEYLQRALKKCGYTGAPQASPQQTLALFAKHMQEFMVACKYFEA